MSTDSLVFGVHPDTEGIMSVKKELEKKACKDNTLFSNLDFCERVFRHHPINKTMTLQVKGQWQCVRIGIVDDVVYTVSLEDHQPRIDGYVCIYHNLIESDDIKRIHFSVHSCQNESRSCFKAAKNALRLKHQGLKITCNMFSITYTNGDVPDDINVIETKCQFKLPMMTAEALLERKCWMEKEKTSCTELIACLNYLIEKYLTLPDPPRFNCRFILQGNKEMAEIISGSEPMKQYVVMWVRNSVSCYPPLE